MDLEDLGDMVERGMVCFEYDYDRDRDRVWRNGGSDALAIHVLLFSLRGGNR
jgi:hypothetical protein